MPLTITMRSLTRVAEAIGFLGVMALAVMAVGGSGVAQAQVSVRLTHPVICDPPCRKDYVCNKEAQCVSECNPTCDPGLVCRQGECVSDAQTAGPAPVQEAAPQTTTVEYASAEQADLPQYGYFGSHPVPWDQGSGFCTETGAHFHTYPPFDKYIFRESQGFFYFIGDAGDFGYSAQTWGYHGNHPIPLEYGGGWCYIDWNHRHLYAPPVGIVYNLGGGYYSYGGPWDTVYYGHREYYHTYYTGYYRSNYYGNRYYESRPRPVYRAEPRVGTPGAYKPGATVHGPGGHPVVARSAPLTAAHSPARPTAAQRMQGSAAPTAQHPGSQPGVQSRVQPQAARSTLQPATPQPAGAQSRVPLQAGHQPAPGLQHAEPGRSPQQLGQSEQLGKQDHLGPQAGRQTPPGVQRPEPGRSSQELGKSEQLGKQDHMTQQAGRQTPPGIQRPEPGRSPQQLGQSEQLAKQQHLPQQMGRPAQPSPQAVPHPAARPQAPPARPAPPPAKKKGH